MKKNLQKIFVTIVCLLVSLFCITACGKSKVEFKVNFVVDGEIYATLNTSGEEIIKMPENPTKDDYDFDGWYWDKDTWQTPFTANSLLDAPLSSDMNVYCKWKPKTVDGGNEETKNGLSFKNLSVDGTNVYGKVSNATETFSFLEEITATGASKFVVALDIYGAQQVATKTIALSVGDNIAYIMETIDGETVKMYTVTVRRRPIYTVSFDSNGGTAVQSQQVEEDSFATEPITRRTGYAFTRWNYDFSKAIAQDTGIQAVWSANTDTKYKTEYYLQNLENDEYTLHETSDSKGTTDTKATAEIKNFAHFTQKATATDSGNIAPDGSLVLKVYYTRDKYNVRAVQNNEKGGTIANIDGKYKYGAKITLSATTNAGYTFNGFYDNEKLLTSKTVYSFNADKDITITAKLLANTDTKYKTEYYLQNLENDEYTLHETSDSKGTTDTKATAEIKNFAHFTHKATATDSGNINGDGSLVLKVYYTRDKYSVVFESNGGTLKSGEVNQLLKYEGSAVAPVFTRTGYTFIGWDKNFSGVNSNITIAAQWKINQYSLTLIYGNGQPNKIITQDYNSVIEAISVPNRANYGFIGWDKTIPKTMPAENITRTAQWNSATSIFKRSASGDTITGLTDNGKKYTEIGIPAEIKGIKITSIGSSAFKDCSGLTSITIPDSVTSIGDSAFKDCSGLTSITIPNSVTSIGSFAFYGCSGLTSITIPDSVTSIGSSAFSGCSGLISVTIPNSVTSIGSSAFAKCSGLTSVTIPDGVISIGESAFVYCSGLKGVYITDIEKWCKISFKNDVSNPLYYAHNLYLNNKLVTDFVIPDNVTSIGNYTFYNCSGLTSIAIPDCVTSIGSSAFSGCSGLISVTIPNSVISIGNYAFYGCNGLTSVTIPDSVTSIGSSAFSGCSGLTSITIPDSVISIGNYAFYGCNGLTSVTIPDSVTSIGSSAFGGCSGLISVIWNAENCTNCGSNNYPIFSNCNKLTSITIGNSVTAIGDYAFSGCGGLASVYITDLEKWCKISFKNDVSNPLYYAHNLYLNNKLVTNLVIPDSVTSIGAYAFAYCSGLTSITIPNSVTSIGDYAFYYCSGLTSITIPNSVTSIGNGVFYGCSRLTSITIPNGVNSIGIGVFYYCSRLTSITIPDSVTSIGSYAFSHCSGLTSITIPNSVTSIGDYAFYGCSGLTSITIPDGVTSIGNNAFYYCSRLTSITIPDSITSIGYAAFSGCSGLEKISVATGNTKYHSAGNCLIETETKTLISGCKNSVIPTDGSVTSIGSYVFEGCSGLTNITIPDSVTSIGSSAFYYCSGLTKVTIGNSVTSIGSYAFYYCSGLTKINFEGTISQWKDITKGVSWAYYVPSSCKIYCTDGTISI